MGTVFRRPAALRDLVEHTAYLDQNAGRDIAERFLRQAESTFEELAEQPMMGAPLPLRHPALAGLRKWRIRDFDNHLIFYLPRPDGAVIIRVLHAARNWWALLGLADEPGVIDEARDDGWQ